MSDFGGPIGSPASIHLWCPPGLLDGARRYRHAGRPASRKRVGKPWTTLAGQNARVISGRGRRFAPGRPLKTPGTLIVGAGHRLRNRLVAEL
jgi:hypothetical protein